MSTVRAVRITDEIFQVGGSTLTAPEDAAIYLVVFDGHAALVDGGGGRGTGRLLANIAAAGVAPEAVEYLLITHCHFDHTGGAAELRRRLGCKVVMHELDATFLETGDAEVTAASWYGAALEPCPVDVRISGTGQEIPLGGRVLTAIHIPGHSPGSVAFTASSGGQKVVFGQDVHGPLHPSLLSNPADYRASLGRLLELESDVLCEGHYGIIRGPAEVAAFIRSFMT